MPMASNLLQGRRVLLLEDDYLSLIDMASELTENGAEVVGPFQSIADAERAMNDGAAADAAILDINVQNLLVYDFADSLRARGIPIIFATGYERSVLPERFIDCGFTHKPVAIARLLDFL